MEKKIVLCRDEVQGPLEEVVRYCGQPIRRSNVFNYCDEHYARVKNLWCEPVEKKEEQHVEQEARGGR